MTPRIAVVIPSYRARDTILPVVSGVGPECDAIYVVDDACPDGTGKLVQRECRDPRVRVLFHERNRGVGGAVLTGFRAALEDGADVLVKLDADGQMDSADIPRLVAPILREEADYTKGNRFYDLTHIRRMPVLRLVGNAVLSFVSKLSSGYWDVFDPTNGFIAIHALVAKRLRESEVHERWFFESDLLFHLGMLRAVVLDVPMHARYGSERSHLRIGPAVLVFALRHVFNTFRRVFFGYFLRDFSAASVQLVLGALLLSFGVVFGTSEWIAASRAGVGAYSGTVMLAALPVIVGTQMLLAFLSFDVSRVPRKPIFPRLAQPAQTGVAPESSRRNAGIAE